MALFFVGVLLGEFAEVCRKVKHGYSRQTVALGAVFSGVASAVRVVAVVAPLRVVVFVALVAFVERVC